MNGREYSRLCELWNHARQVVKSRLNDFDLPYTDKQVDKLIEEYWIEDCSDEENVNEIVLQHQYNIS